MTSRAGALTRVRRPWSMVRTRQLWLWLLPAPLFFFVKREQPRLHTLIAALVGLGVVVLVARRPYRSLGVLLVGLPFSQFLLSLLLRLGLPAQIVRAAGFWKEAVVAGLVAAALRNWGAQRPKVDWLDRLAIGYLVTGTLYLLLPKLLVGSAIGGSLSLYAREIGWRGDVLYFGIFLACRHLGLESSEIAALFWKVLRVGIVLALIGVYEFVAPSSFNHFVINVIRLPAYEARILHTPLGSNQFVTYSPSHLPRIGSVLDNLTIPWYFILSLGIALEMHVRGVGRRWVLASIPLFALCVVMTQSRDAMLGAGLTVLFALRRQVGRSVAKRARVGAMLALLAIAGLPVMIYGGLAHRFVSSQNSNNLHGRGIQQGIQVMERYPLGRGLATGAGAGQNVQSKGLISGLNVFVPEDQWLQIGTQLGVLGLVVYTGALVLLLRRLRPSDTTDTRSAAGAAGVRNGMVGILGGGLLLQPFIGPVIAWSVFGLCGLGVAIVDHDQRQAYVGRLPELRPSG